MPVTGGSDFYSLQSEMRGSMTTFSVRTIRVSRLLAFKFMGVAPRLQVSATRPIRI